MQVSVVAFKNKKLPQTQTPFSVLFVCLGNICRSPAAEGVFTYFVKKRGFDSKIRIDSAGTINYHEVGISVNVLYEIEISFLRKQLLFLVFFMMGFFRLFKKLIFFLKGNQTDSRMRAASKRCGIEITSISRPIKSSDFVEFDLILAMDKQNRERGYMEAFNRWKFRDPLPEDAHKKVRLICSYCKKHDETEVPDPCYGGPEGFKKSEVEYHLQVQR
ncbi:putative low molecular weight protein-tyrosine-phosphatase slr0328 isoform X2 [Trifolium pratense]|uniref:putative low molecular weight protein-tyrosine-phosphatase slr0328 isoform X2 n=1 Tax=Trifolium pratense TaxID=57577 RepID=UPI001E691659|nr:putative low molecular weight protein-tyrosine-phosphatase slr0328 isoform X2 [Trifolium pratense]XP_045796347.1 putative low molecular weight protein-tyrosine-phosphatase slr0328 isoform X2 [Trifolium pratense]XP_045796348.1 putative low molecular weight protein-tyrosine-phosphatase slr0328 isoform X2 [Trifolium pratense]XP_045796349.1 putative low molecular weight protein-tyrosine-phosphatase slr0328 isoform X2 [Trifolium pratense]